MKLGVLSVLIPLFAGMAHVESGNVLECQSQRRNGASYRVAVFADTKTQTLIVEKTYFTPGKTGPYNQLELPIIVDRTSIPGKVIIEDTRDESRKASLLLSVDGILDRHYAGIFESAALRILALPVKCVSSFHYDE